MAKYIHNPQLVSAYDIIDETQVVGGPINTVLWASAQPAGYRAVLSNEKPVLWSLSYQGRTIATSLTNLEQIKSAIVENHNDNELAHREDARAWRKYYDKHTATASSVDPQLLAAIYRASYRKLPAEDQTVTTRDV